MTTQIVIVGGVAGGMSCAARARRLDESAQITVLERGPEVSFANCGLPYHVGGEIPDEGDLVLQTPASLRASLNLDVRTGHDVIDLDPERRTVTARTADGTVEFGYDALVLAPGARPVRPPIPGLDSVPTHFLRTVSDARSLRTEAAGGARHAVVLGAGFIGLEAAEALAQRGLTVTVVDLADHVLPPLEAELASLITAELTRIGVRVHAPATAEAVQDGAVLLSTGERVPADLVVLAAGVRPDTAPFAAAGITRVRDAIVVDEHGRTSVPGIWAVGDATVSAHAVTGVPGPVPLAGPANRAGRLVADHLIRGSDARPIPRPLGTAIIRVGELTAALTGANRAELTSAGIAHRTLHLHPNQHAGYFPGASQIHLVVQIDAADGRLLGAQAVGADGVDKRIDVLATAIRAGLTVDDLIDLDLAYSPPYGQAKDAVNLVGMVGSNVRDGTLRLWYAEDLPRVRTEALLLDTRSAAEWSGGHLPDALHIPHTELRSRLDEVRAAAAGRPVRVLCASGVRSAIAHRILTQHGVDSASLSGGMLTLRALLGEGELV